MGAKRGKKNGKRGGHCPLKFLNSNLLERGSLVGVFKRRKDGFDKGTDFSMTRGGGGKKGKEWN